MAKAAAWEGIGENIVRKWKHVSTKSSAFGVVRNHVPLYPEMPEPFGFYVLTEQCSLRKFESWWRDVDGGGYRPTTLSHHL